VGVADLREGASNVAVTARILSVERREVEVDGAAKAVFSGVLADETGKTQFSAWKDFSLKPDEVVRVEGAYVKTWRGIPQVSFDERATITRLKPDLLPPSERLNVSPRMWIEDLAERGGAADVTVRGNVTSDDYGLMMIVESAKLLKVDVQAEAREMLEGLEGSA